MTRSRFVHSAILVLAVGAFCASATAIDLFNATFEDNNYALGTLTGQNGWIAYRNANVAAPQVSVAAAHGGDQGVTIDGARMGLYPTGRYRGYYYPPINYDLTGTGNTVIEYSCDVALFIAPADSAQDIAWQTQFYTAAGGTYGGVGVEALGDGTYAAYAFSFLGDLQQTDYTPGTWLHIVARLDFAAGTLTASFNGNQLASVMMDDIDPIFGDADLTLICADPFVSYAYVDNYHLTANSGANPCPCPGDFNNDHAVGLSDLTLFLASFGGAPSNPCMDVNGDHVIGLSDLTAFLSHFGTTCN